ncbi:MAG: hypothetical protein ABGX22_12280 [Pirellulaceae bacterium]
MTQSQAMPDGRHIIVVTQGGLTLIGPRRDTEEIVTPDNATRAYTTLGHCPTAKCYAPRHSKRPIAIKSTWGFTYSIPKASNSN